MALADRQTQRDTRTNFEKWLDSLSENNQAVILGWLMDRSVSTANILAWIREDDEDDEDDDFKGYSASKDTVQAWRRKHAG